MWIICVAFASSAGSTETETDCVSRVELNAINQELEVLKDMLSAQENNSGRFYLLDYPGDFKCTHYHHSGSTALLETGS